MSRNLHYFWGYFGFANLSYSYEVLIWQFRILSKFCSFLSNLV